MRYTYDQPDYLDENGLRHLIDELRTLIEEIVNGNLDVSKFATKEELNSAVSSIDLSDYATKSEIPSLEGYATKSYVDENIADVATNGEIDLSNYVTKDIVYTKEEIDNKVTELEPITEDEIKALFETEGLATTSYVDNAVSNVPTTDLTGYATEEYVSTAINSIPATDLSNYYTKSEVDALIATDDGNTDSGNTGGDEGGGETTTPTVTLAITGNASLKNGFARTYKAVYTDADGTDVTANYSTTWELTSDTVAVNSYITQEVGSNQNKLLYEDENEDVLEETVTLTAIPSDSTIANASIELTLTSAF